MIGFVFCSVMTDCFAGCAKCVELEEQLKMKLEVIKQLKEGMTLNTLLQIT